MRKHWKRALSPLAVATAVTLVAAALALGKKPPKPPPPPEPVVTVSYSIQFLGTLPGATSSSAQDLNIHGEVVGFSPAFLYSDRDGDGIKEMVALDDLLSEADRAQWHLGFPRGINDAGQIAGSGSFNGEVRAFRLTPGVGGEPAVLDDLGTLGGDGSLAYGINNQGDVTGISWTPAGDYTHAFVWTEEGGMTDIGTLDGRSTHPQRINNGGQVTGFASVIVVIRSKNKHLQRAFRYTPGGGMEDLGDFGADSPSASHGYDINDDGYVVGDARNLPKIKGVSGRHAFLYTDHMIDLGTLGGYSSYAYGINSSCHVVGISSIKEKFFTHYYGFLYTDITDTGDFVMAKLEDLIVDLPPDYVGPITPRKINDNGQICGDADGQAILLTPVEP